MTTFAKQQKENNKKFPPRAEKGAGMARAEGEEK